jgi:hypothetical protein
MLQCHTCNGHETAHRVALLCIYVDAPSVFIIAPFRKVERTLERPVLDAQYAHLRPLSAHPSCVVARAACYTSFILWRFQCAAPLQCRVFNELRSAPLHK